MQLSNPGGGLLDETEAALFLALARTPEGVSGRRAVSLAGIRTLSRGQRALSHLAELGLLSTRHIGNTVLYSVNRSHVLWETVESALAAPARMQQILGETVLVNGGDRVTAAVFGSTARGESSRESDLDIALVFPADLDVETRIKVLDAVSERLEAATGNAVQIVSLIDSELRQMVKAADPLIISWEADAITITGPNLGDLIDEARL